MKLACIDHTVGTYLFHISRCNFYESLQKDGFVIHYAPTWKEFEEKHGPLDQYDGLIMHPGLRHQRECVIDIPAKYPTLPFVLITFDPPGLCRREYGLYSGVPVFFYSDPNGVKEYFDTYWNARRATDDFVFKRLLI